LGLGGHAAGTNPSARAPGGGQHGWWFPERLAAEPELFGVFESNANMLCPDEAEFCSPEIGSWPHTALALQGRTRGCVTLQMFAEVGITFCSGAL